MTFLSLQCKFYLYLDEEASASAVCLRKMTFLPKHQKLPNIFVVSETVTEYFLK